MAAVVSAAMTEFTGDMPATAGTLESNAQLGFVKSIYSFKTERIKVPDDFKSQS